MISRKTQENRDAVIKLNYGKGSMGHMLHCELAQSVDRALGYAKESLTGLALTAIAWTAACGYSH